jgi:glutamate racemase
VDGNEGTVRELIRRLKERNLLEKNAPSTEYYYSGRRVQDKEELHRLEGYLLRLGSMYALA